MVPEHVGSGKASWNLECHLQEEISWIQLLSRLVSTIKSIYFDVKISEIIVQVWCPWKCLKIENFIACSVFGMLDFTLKISVVETSLSVSGHDTNFCEGLNFMRNSFVSRYALNVHQLIIEW